MRQWDTDGSGFIDYTEFIAAEMSRQTMISEKKLETAFKMFDDDNSGEISLAEMKKVLGNDDQI